MAAPGIAIRPPTTTATPAPSAVRTPLSRILLACGIAAPLLYGAILVLVPTQWPAYNSASQTVSELSAIGAPTRALWVPLALVYTLLVTAFGWGIWASAGENRRLRVVGALFIASGVLGLFWPPMHLREALAAGGGTLSDTLHIVWTAVSGLLTLLAMSFGAVALGKWFRGYCITSIALLLVTGAMTSVDAPKISANLPTPWMGVWERINIAFWMLWLVALAVALLRRPSVRKLP